MSKAYDLLVVGGGHAGVEASLAGAKLGFRVGLITLRVHTIAMMPCNPAVGGLGKGHLVRELDALGGQMGQFIDATRIQFRYLNTSKGRAVKSSRAQADRHLYQRNMGRYLAQVDGVDIIEGEVSALLEKNGSISGVKLRSGQHLAAPAVVLCTGTFLKGLLHFGALTYAGGRAGEPASTQLSQSLKDLGLNLLRLKTGTTPRLDARSIDFDRVQVQTGVDADGYFSYERVPNTLPQADCYITYTNDETHELIASSLDKSPLYSGRISGTGPRYCPSIEDKIVRFPHRKRHQIFLEPEGLGSHEVYPNGISTCLPIDIQVKMVQSIRGLEHATIIKPGYAVEYDCLDPLQLDASLALSHIPGLYTAGQINGTSGYEEAACQGLIAGINACRYLKGESPFILSRDRAYIGVMVDDLSVRGVDEPYRMLTSRAEHRLILREDNADIRLREAGHQLGMVDGKTFEAFEKKVAMLETGMELITEKKVYPSKDFNFYLETLGLQPLKNAATYGDFLCRPNVSLDVLLPWDASLAQLPIAILGELETRARYAGYIARQTRKMERNQEREWMKIPPELDLASIPGLSTEVRERLERAKPQRIGQAARIRGVTPAAIDILTVAVHRHQLSSKTR